MSAKKQQQPKAEISAADEMYQAACTYLKVVPKTLDEFKAFFSDDEKEAAWQYSMHRIARVTQARKEGHEFNYNDFSEYKYFPVWDMETYGDAPAGSGFAFHDSVYVRDVSRVGSRLSSKSDEVCKEIALTMEDDYRVVIRG